MQTKAVEDIDYIYKSISVYHEEKEEEEKKKIDRCKARLFIHEQNFDRHDRGTNTCDLLRLQWQCKGDIITTILIDRFQIALNSTTYY